MTLSNNLCLCYLDNLQAQGTIKLATYNGSSFNIFSAPTNYVMTQLAGTLYNRSFFFTDFISIVSSPTYAIARFDGLNFTRIPYPPNINFIGAGILFGLYNNNLFLDYINSSGVPN